MTTQSQPPPYQPGGSYRHILHADLDAFYAAVEVLDNPNLDGKAVMVGGDPENRGVVATASYEARVFGVHSAMPMRTAVRLCPQGIIIHPRFDRYRQMSRAVMDVFHDFTELVEPLSKDEAYLDITEAVDGGRLPLAIALELKNSVHEKTGLTLSVGAGTSKSVAKIASDLHKPDGLVVVAPGEEGNFWRPSWWVSCGASDPRPASGSGPTVSKPSVIWRPSPPAGSNGGSASVHWTFSPERQEKTGSRCAPKEKPSR